LVSRVSRERVATISFVLCVSCSNRSPFQLRATIAPPGFRFREAGDQLPSAAIEKFFTQTFFASSPRRLVLAHFYELL
jgi:hypothetical protein